MSSDQPLPPSLAETGIRDTRLISRAIKKRWPIPDGKREALIDRQIAIAESDSVSPRESTSAFKAVLAADQQNIAAETKLRRPKPKPTIVVERAVFIDGKLYRQTAAGLIPPADLAEAKLLAADYITSRFAARDAADAAKPVDDADAVTPT